jgi:carboxyl-terminal processing protease
LSNPDDKESAPEQMPAETQGVEAPAEKPAEPTATKETKPEDKEAFVGSERQQIARPSEDYQLARALDLLRGLSLLQKQAAK